MSESLLSVEDLSIEYETRQETIKAVNNAEFSVDKGEYFGLVGESGCGKTTLAKSLVGGLDRNGRISSGKIYFKGRELQDLTEQQYRNEIRWKEISFIPQSAMNSLNPIRRLSDQAWNIADTHTNWSKKRAMDRFRDMFQVVGLPTGRIHDYPFEFSGGMQQRALISLALFLEPSLIIADEPTTALDVIMQDQILKYFDMIKEEMDISMIMISHDISLIFETCDSTAIMHGGQIAESGTTHHVYETPRHPYSILLQRAFPDINFPDRDLEVIEGTPPDLTGDVDYCTFVNRCPWAIEECTSHQPPLDESESGHRVACIRASEMDDLASDLLQFEEGR